MSIFDDKNQLKIDGGSENIFDIDAATDVGSMDTEAYVNHMNGGTTVTKCLVDALAHAKVYASQGTAGETSSTMEQTVPPRMPPLGALALVPVKLPLPKVRHLGT